MAKQLAARMGFNDLDAPAELQPGAKHEDTQVADLIRNHHALCAHYGNGLIPAQAFDGFSNRITTAGGAAAYVRAYTYLVVPRAHMKKAHFVGTVTVTNGGNVKIVLTTTAGGAVATTINAFAGAATVNFTATTAVINRGNLATMVDVYLQAGAVNGNTIELIRFAGVDADLANAGELP